jgi:hypothetical protein
MHIAGRAYVALAITLTRELAAVGAINAEDMAKMVSQKKLVEDVGGWGKLAPQTILPACCNNSVVI